MAWYRIEPHDRLLIGTANYVNKYMLAEKNTKNQITLPEAVITRFAGVEYFDVSTDGECIILRPLQKSRADDVRIRLAQLGIDDEDVRAAISWARQTS
jgi:hypothetical protein